MKITDEQKSFVILQLRGYSLKSSEHMERMFESELLPFIRERELAELERLQETGEMKEELRKVSLNFLLAQAHEQFPEADDLMLLSRVNNDHVETGAQFAGLLLSAVLQALAVDELQEQYAENSVLDLDAELKVLLDGEGS